MIIKPITLNIEQEIWNEFVKNLPVGRTKNGTIVELIERYNRECKENENRVHI